LQKVNSFWEYFVCICLIETFFQTNLAALAMSFVVSFTKKQSHTHVYICTDTQSNFNNILCHVHLLLYICLANGGVGYTVFAFLSFLQKTCTLSSSFLKLYI